MSPRTGTLISTFCVSLEVMPPSAMVSPDFTVRTVSICRLLVTMSLASKYNGLGLSGISMAAAGLAVVISSPVRSSIQCALYVLC